MKNTNNKKVYVLGGVVAVLILLIVSIGVSLSLSNKNDFLNGQVVDGLSFENANITYKNGVSTFSVIVYNENKKIYNANSIDIKITNKEGKSTTITANLDTPLESDEGRLLMVESDQNITDISSLQYKINK